MAGMVIKILGTGCPNCVRLEKNTREALSKGGLQADIVLVKDVPGIMSYGIMHTPGLVVNEKVLMAGRVPNADEVLRLITGAVNG